MIRATVNAVALAGALRDGVAQVNGTMPILQHALIEAVGAELRITTTDFETLVRTTIPAEVKTEGATCVNAQLMRAATAAGSDLVIEEAEGSVTVKRGPRSRVKVPTLPAEQWPSPDTYEWRPFPVPWEELAAAIDVCRYAAGVNDIRPYCIAVCIAKGFIACLDGIRMALSPSDYAGASILIPIKPAALLRKYLSTGCDMQVGIVRNDIVRIGVTSGTDRFELKPFGANAVPDLLNVLPSCEPDSVATFDRLVLRAAVARILPFCVPLDAKKETRFPVARLSASESVLTFKDRTGDNTDEAPIENASGNLTGAINLELLAETLDAIETEKVTVSQFGTGSALRFTVTASEHRARHLISGCRV